MKYGGCVYIMTNKYHTVLYTGVTSDLKKRIHQHKNKEYKTSFTSNYNCDKLVYFENFNRIEEAIAKEKTIKGGSRTSKEELITNLNPEWNDLSGIVEQW
jgi:putative endonuclease